MPLEFARRWAEEMPTLASQGVSYISFTGGEPLLAIRQLKILAQAAVRAGMRCTLATACHWARTPSSAMRRVLDLEAIQVWHLSTDIFHTPHVPAEFVINAALAALSAGKDVVVRVAAPRAACQEHEQLMDDLRAQLPGGVEIAVQPLTRNGRARDLPLEIPMREAPAWPCTPNGMTVRSDGSVAPCCAGLVDQREDHPFQYRNAGHTGVAAAHRAWAADPLLQLIRAVGFVPVLQWVSEAFPDHPLNAGSPAHPCECCIELWRYPGTGQAIRQRAERPENRRKISALIATVFGENVLQSYAGAPVKEPLA